MVVGSLHTSPSVLSAVQLTPGGISKSEGVSDSSVKVGVSRLKTSPDSAGSCARRSEQGAVSVIVSIVVTLSVERAAAFVMSIRAVIIRTLTAF